MGFMPANTCDLQRGIAGDKGRREGQALWGNDASCTHGPKGWLFYFKTCLGCLLHNLTMRKEALDSSSGA